MESRFYSYIAYDSSNPNEVCCILSPVFLSGYDEFVRYRPLMQFDATDWNGRDERFRTLLLKGLESTGRKVKLNSFQGYHGYDNDMGHIYEFLFKFDTIELCRPIKTEAN